MQAGCAVCIYPSPAKTRHQRRQAPPAAPIRGYGGIGRQIIGERLMQDRYAGDIGDFGKFALLKALSAAGFKVGVNWFLTCPQSFEKQDDGKYHIPHKYFACDRPLAEALTAISHLPITERTVRKLQDAGLVDAVWFSDKVPSKEERPAWHCRAVSVLSACDIVFLDPDNGLLVKSVGKGSARSVKYVFPEEIADYIAQGISVVFYNHRQRKAEDVYFRGIRERLDTQNELRYCAFSKITFPKCSVRDYILLAAQSGHQQRIVTALSSLLSGPFGCRGLCRKNSRPPVLINTDQADAPPRVFFPRVKNRGKQNSDRKNSCRSYKRVWRNWQTRWI